MDLFRGYRISLGIPAISWSSRGLPVYSQLPNILYKSRYILVLAYSTILINYHRFSYDSHDWLLILIFLILIPSYSYHCYLLFVQKMLMVQTKYGHDDALDDRLLSSVVRILLVMVPSLLYIRIYWFTWGWGFASNSFVPKDTFLAFVKIDEWARK